jgi:hypothetical protein
MYLQGATLENKSVPQRLKTLDCMCGAGEGCVVCLL